MKVKLLYWLIFYKLFKVASKRRTGLGAALFTGITMGVLFVLWAFYVLSAFNLKAYIPGIVQDGTFILSVIANTAYLLINKQYIVIFEEMSKKEIPVLYNVIFFVLLSWTIVGVFFM